MLLVHKLGALAGVLAVVCGAASLAGLQASAEGADNDIFAFHERVALAIASTAGCFLLFLALLHEDEKDENRRPCAVVGGSLALAACVVYTGVMLAATDAELAVVRWTAAVLFGAVLSASAIALVVSAIRAFQAFLRGWQDGEQAEAAMRVEGVVDKVLEWLLAVVVILVVLAGVAAYRRPSLYVTRTDMTGKVVIITDSCAERGFLHAETLATWGAEVIVACSDEHEAKHSAARIAVSSGNAKVHGMRLDLRSVDSVRDFADGFSQAHSRLDVLVNSADVGVTEATSGENLLTQDGVDSVLQVNYLSHALLTDLLLPLLKASAPSRIVHVGSESHRNGVIPLLHASGEPKVSAWTGLLGPTYMTSMSCVYVVPICLCLDRPPRPDIYEFYVVLICRAYRSLPGPASSAAPP